MPASDAFSRGLRAAGLALAIAACGAPAPVEGAARPALQASLFGAEPAGQAPLPNPLREISGLAVTADGRLLGHNDERAVVRQIDPASGAITKSFALGDPVVKGDFEGMAIADTGDFYLITSTGTLYRFREGADGQTVPFTTADTGLADDCEIEGLAFRRAPASLIVACKAMLARSMRKTVAFYSWSLEAGALDPAPWRTFPEDALGRAAGVEKFHPSSVDIDRATGRLVVLAARESAMVELGSDGAILAGRRLGAGHAQAEGAAILPDGALVIADEATEGAGAHITRYPRRP